MDDSHDKPAMRKHYRAIRDAIPAELRAQRSEAILDSLLSLDQFRQAHSVFVYVSAGSEAGTHSLIKTLIDRGKQVLVPRIKQTEGEMHAVVLRSFGDLVPGRFGILEPTTNEICGETPDITIVPGLAFTTNGERLGQGGGYYDRYLQQHAATCKVGLCFSEQIGKIIPVKDYDVEMDQVIAL